MEETISHLDVLRCGISNRPMTVPGQTRSSDHLRRMSVGPASGHTQITSRCRRSAMNGLMHRSKPALSLDHLVGNCEHCRPNVEADRLRRLEIDHQLEVGGLLDRN